MDSNYGAYGESFNGSECESHNGSECESNGGSECESNKGADCESNREEVLQRQRVVQLCGERERELQRRELLLCGGGLQLPQQRELH